MPAPRSAALAEALRLVRGGAGIRQAAEATGLAPSSVSRAWRAEQRPRCPCCGRVIASPRTPAAPAGTD